MVKITYYGHACFGISDGNVSLLLDPFLRGNALAAISPEEAEADYILVTHGHGDHVGDTEEIAKRTGAVIISTVEVAGALFGDYKTLASNIGGWIPTPFGKVKLATAIHGSGVPGGLACGFIIEIGGRRIYHMGDTALTKDFELLADEAIDVLLAPIGDFYTMGPKDAVRAAKMIRPKLVIPMHFNTFPAVRQDPDLFAEQAAEAGISSNVLMPGESITI